VRWPTIITISPGHFPIKGLLKEDHRRKEDMVSDQEDIHHSKEDTRNSKEDFPNSRDHIRRDNHDLVKIHNLATMDITGVDFWMITGWKIDHRLDKTSVAA
jgi:hypothetical protein